MLTHLQQELVSADLVDVTGRPTFTTSLTKARREALERLKVTNGIKVSSATLSIYLLWHGVKDLPTCSCGSGKKVTWPTMKACSVRCARQQVVGGVTGDLSPEEVKQPAQEVLAAHGLDGTQHGLTTTQRRVLRALCLREGIDPQRYRPRHAVDLLQKGLKRYPSCECGSGKEVVPRHGSERFCSPRCSAARSAAQAATEATNLQRHGVKNAWQRPEVVRKVKAANRSNYVAAVWSDRLLQVEAENDVTLEGDRAWVHHDHPYRWRCVSGHGFTASINDGRRPRCPTCYPRTSQPQRDIQVLLEKGGFAVTANDRSIISPYELDIVLPEHRVAIEVNGVRFHGDAKPAGYHRMKLDRCTAAGWRLVQVTDAEWLGKPLLVEDRLLSILGVRGRRLQARSCEVRHITAADARWFCEGNHLQGWSVAATCLGLFSGQELVGVATLGKPRFNRKADHELVRLCFKLGTSVVGGASKLLAAFRRQHQGSIISYCDLRYSTGEVYRKMGFTQTHATAPGYFYVNLKGDVLSRHQAQKHRLHKVLKRFDPLLSERDNLYANGYWRIEDAGHLVFVLS